MFWVLSAVMCSYEMTRLKAALSTAFELSLLPWHFHLKRKCSVAAGVYSVMSLLFQQYLKACIYTSHMINTDISVHTNYSSQNFVNQLQLAYAITTCVCKFIHENQVTRGRVQGSVYAIENQFHEEVCTYI